MKNEKCPKCGFGLVDNNYCVRCGYVKNITIEKMEKYQEPTKEIELYLKEDYLKILHQENILKILILGPFYLGYLNFPILGTILELIELIILYLGFSINNYLWEGGLPPLIFSLINFIIIRILEATFFDLMILKLINKKIDKLKKSNKKEIFYQHKGHSILKLFISILLTILFLIIWVIIYRIIRGND